MKIKKAQTSQIVSTLVSALGPQIGQLIGEQPQQEQPDNPKSLIEQTINQVMPEVTEQLTQQFTQKQQEAMQQAGQQMAQPTASSDNEVLKFAAAESRQFLMDLNNRYAKEQLNLMEALRVWKTARLTPTMIRDQVANDVEKRISLAEAKLLYKIGTDVSQGISYEDPYIVAEIKDDELPNTIKLTASVRNSLEKVGQNLYRTKTASTLWKIDMKILDDGQQIPYLIRVDAVEAQDEQEKR